MLEKIFTYSMITFFAGVLLFGAVSAVIAIPVHNSTGTVISKQFIPDHDDSFWAGMWIPSRSGNAWRITLRVDEMIGSCHVTQRAFEHLQVGTKVAVRYRRALSSSGMDIEKVEFTD